MKYSLGQELFIFSRITRKITVYIIERFHLRVFFLNVTSVRRFFSFKVFKNIDFLHKFLISKVYYESWHYYFGSHIRKFSIITITQYWFRRPLSNFFKNKEYNIHKGEAKKYVIIESLKTNKMTYNVVKLISCTQIFINTSSHSLA